MKWIIPYLKCVMDNLCRSLASLRPAELLHPVAVLWLAISSLRFFLSRRMMRFLYFISCLSRCEIASSFGDSPSNAQRCFPFSWQSNSCRSSAINGDVVGLSLTRSGHAMYVASYNLGRVFMRGKLFSDILIDRWSVIIVSGKLCMIGVAEKHDDVASEYGRIR